jgi:hypothetical protein
MTDRPGSIKDPDDLSGDAFLFYSDNRGLSAARANRQGLEDYAMTPTTASASTQPRPASSDRPGANTAGSPSWGARTGFDHVYDQPDPRGYFQAFGPFGYQTPHHAQQVFRRLVAALTPNNAGRQVTALDICCSYGINAALLNHDLTLADLCARYTGPETTTLSVEDLVGADQVFYAVHRHPTGPLARVIGLDPARNAIDYARAVGLVDAGFAENLETTPASAALLATVRDVRLITVTGGTSFLSARTFQALLDNAERPVWLAAFVLRTGSYKPIADALAGYGLVTETSTRTFLQRRFTSPAEQRYAIDAVIATGHDPSGKETDGAYHTNLYLSRPSTDIAAMPLTDLLPDS